MGGWGEKKGPAPTPAPKADEREHVLHVGLTPKGIESISLEALVLHKRRTEAYLRYLERELKIRGMVDDHKRGRSTLTSYPVAALDEYKTCWRIARRRAGLGDW